MSLSRTVSAINDDFSRKSQMFPTPCIFYAPADEVPFGIWYRRNGSKKLECWGYQKVEKVNTKATVYYYNVVGYISVHTLLYGRYFKSVENGHFSAQGAL